MTTTVRWLLVLPLIGGLLYLVVVATQASTKISTTVSGNGSLADGLVGHWTFDGLDVDWGSTTAEIKDRSGNGNHGDAQNGLSTNSVRVGIIGQALDFDGIDDRISVPDVGSDFDVLNGGAITQSFWINFTSSESINGVVGKNSQWGVTEDNGTAGKIEGCLNSSCATSDFKLNDGLWHHIVYIVDDIVDEQALWVDGVKQADTESVNPSSNNSNPVLIGQVDYLGRDYWKGSIDDVRIYNRALSAAEVERLYQLGEGTKVAQTLTTNPSLTDGLVGHWTFDGMDVDWSDVNSELKDISGSGYHGEAYAMTAASAPVSGVMGQGMEFDGVEDCVKLGNVLEGHTAVTYTAWVYQDVVPADYLHVSSKKRVNYFRVKDYGSSTSTKLHFNIANGGSYDTGWISNAAVPIREWHHLAASWRDSDKQIKLYIDGELDTTDVSTDSMGTSGWRRRIGAYDVSGNSCSYHFDGKLDDVRIYDRALEDAEVTQLYQLGAGTKVAQTISNPTSPLETGLVGHWTFDGPDVDWGSTTAEIKDQSGNGNHGDATGMNTRSVTPGRLGQGMSFDGVNDLVDIPQYTFSGPFTIGFWWNIEVDASYRMAVGLNSDGTQEKIGHSSNGTHFFVRTVGGGSSNTSVPLPSGDGWHYVVVRRNASDVVDLIVDGTDSNQLYTQSGNSRWDAIGVATGDSHYLNGSLDDVRFYDRDLSDEEVEMLYQLGR